MKWILVLYWSLNGQPVLNHEVFAAKAACEARLLALRDVFEYLHHEQWTAQCQQEKNASP
jgi:hypothetical protein